MQHMCSQAMSMKNGDTRLVRLVTEAVGVGRDVECFFESRRVLTSTSGARPSSTSRTPSAETATTLSLFIAQLNSNS